MDLCDDDNLKAQLYNLINDLSTLLTYLSAYSYLQATLKWYTEAYGYSFGVATGTSATKEFSQVSDIVRECGALDMPYMKAFQIKAEYAYIVLNMWGCWM